ncbi:MAG TPA: multidrug effflux MFS transporter, partial [Rhodanobacteraceae bacterium]
MVTAARAAQKAGHPALWLLAFMMAAGPFGDTEYTPAMPAMAKALHADYGMVQFSMSAYLVASALSQLLYGPISDRYGRRPVMLVGACILSLGALACMLSFSIWPLIGGRFIQGVGACAGGVIADAMVRDAFAKERRQPVYAKINAAFALAPAIGPVAGTYVEHAFGWHANFAILLGISLLLTGAVWWRLPETLREEDPRALEPSRLWRNAREVIGTRGFLFYVALGGLCVGVVYTALIGAPDLVINVLGMGSGAIVIVAISILVAFVIGAGSCAWLSRRRVPHLLIIAAGLSIVLAGSIALLLIALLVRGGGGLAMYLSPIAFCFIGVGLVVPVSTAKAMAPFAENAGAAS